MIIGISNDLRFKEMLDPRVLSSLSEEEIIFKPYTATELEQILWDRIQLAFFDNTVDQGAVKLAAAISGSENGDARKALDLIRVAGEIVEAQGGNKITTDHIKMAYNSIDRERTLEVIRTLPLHSKLIIGALYLMTIGGQNNRIKSSVLYQKYSLLTGEIGESPLSSRRFYSLLTELSLLGIVNRRIDNYGRRGGRVTTVKFDVPLTLIKKSLVEDPIIGDLLINKFD
jgi:cell division control protein 6